VFAGGPERTPAPGTRSLTISGASFGGYDDDLNQQQGIGGNAPGLGPGGYYGGLLGDLQFTAGGERRPVTIMGSTEYRLYEGRSGFDPVQHSGAVTFSPAIGRQLRLNLGQSAYYSPSYALLGNDAEPADVGTGVDARLATRETFNFVSTAQMVYQRSLRTTIAFEYELRHTDVSGSPSFQTQNAGVLFRRAVTRHAAVRLGYRYEEYGAAAAAGSADPTSIGELHDIDTGFDYQRPLSFSRRTTVGFTTGFVITRQESLGRIYQVVGSASAQHLMGRSWSLSGRYQRDMRYLEVIGAPALEDEWRVGLEGLLSPRLELLLAADHSAGQVNPAANSADSGYTRSSGTARLRLAITRTLAAYGEYGFYRYGFEQGVALPDDFSTTVNRSTARFGLTVVFPMARARAGRVERASR
jgi:hypothetical protein